MVDYQSHYRTHAFGFTSDPPRVGVKSLRELYHESGRKLFKARHDRPVHDCRHNIMKDHTDTREFETWLLAHGLTETYKAVADLHSKTKTQTNSKKSEKLLYKFGKYGSDDGDFNYPRGICTTVSGDVLVADTKNHRIQHFTHFGVFVKQYGSYGQLEGEFNEPSDVTELPNGDVAVADSKNGRIQIFTDGFGYKYHFCLPGPGLPYSLGCSREMNIAVSTTDKKLYIYNTNEKELKHCFPVGSRVKPGARPVHISMTYNSKIVVGDPDDSHIYMYSLNGRLLRRFRPEAHTPGLTVCVGDVCVTPLGQILVVDTLNHVISLYADTGDFQKLILTPLDDAGTIHSLSLGPEGHMVVTEFSIGGEHCIKFFRYHPCPCHEGLTPASKKRTQVASSEI